MLSIQIILGQFFIEAPNLAPLATCAALLLVIAVVWSYTPQVRALGWPWRGLLPMLRGMTVLALAASVVKPVAVRLASASQRGSVLVLVDRSRSMSVADNSRSSAQWVALADAMGKLPFGIRTDLAPGLSATLEHLAALCGDVKAAQDDLDYARVSGREIELRQLRLRQAALKYFQAVGVPLLGAEGLDAESDLYRRLADLAQAPSAEDHKGWKTDLPARIARAQDALLQHQNALDEQLYQTHADVRTACDELSHLSRFELIQMALLRPGGILSRLEAQANVSAFTVAETLQPLELAAPNAPGGQAFGTSAEGHQSDLTRGIAEAIAGRNVRAVVLLSDGRQVGGDPTLAAGLTAGAAPVFTVACAASAPPHDLAFAGVRIPSSVFAGQAFNVHVDLRHEGINKGDISVHLEAPGQSDQVRAAVIRDIRRPASVDFPVTLSVQGAQKLRFWFPKDEGEISDANNHVERWVKVVPRRMKVLFVAGSPTWDFQYARNALARSPEIDVSVTLLGPGAKWSPPAREITSADVIVLFDPPAAALDATHWDQIEQFVERKGGSLLLVAGSHLPLEYGRAAPIAVTKLLPYRPLAYSPVWRVWPGESPEFHFVPAQSAQSMEMLRLADVEAPPASEGGVSPWEELPGAYRFVQLPDASDHEARNRNVRELLVESASRLPVLTEMQLGAGRVFFMGTNETWRWRAKVGQRYQDRFWRQLITYASDQPYFARNETLALDVDKISVEPGETFHVRARLSDEKASAGRAADLEILRAGKVFGTRALESAGPAGSGRFAASFSLPEGEYSLRWSRSVSRGPTVSVQIPLHVAASDENEMADLSGDERMLRKIANATGGEFFGLEKINALPERVMAADTNRSRFAELPLWDSPYLFCFVLGCLGTEWALRKRVGLA
jgi:hypothetical protein